MDRILALCHTEQIYDVTPSCDDICAYWFTKEAREEIGRRFRGTGNDGGQMDAGDDDSRLME